ncbi:MAG TPA: hypothetical protein VM124_03255 [Candidatus Limnocylindrales bacterium]|nr:hypothetical protein [Candidatus Limnocylindrales bacterium]
MNWLFLAVAAIILLFSFVIMFGAPFLPTLKVHTSEALDLLNLKPGQTLTELGSGDGRILRAAAERGMYAIGYELNPLLVLWSKLIHWRYRRLITVHWGNYWRHKLPVTDGIYVFLLNSYMEKLDKKITQEITQKVKVVSFAFEIPGKKPTKEMNGLMLYTYEPAMATK